MKLCTQEWSWCNRTWSR